MVKVLEHNCFVLLSLCNRLFERVMSNYSCDAFKTTEEIDALGTDFRIYFRDMILSDTRELGGVSPKSLQAKIGKICKQVWSGQKPKILEEMDPRKKTVIMSYQDCQMFIAAYFKFYRDEVEVKLRAALSLVPRDDVFLFRPYETVKGNISNCIEQTIDTLAASHQNTIQIFVRVNLERLLQVQLSPATRFILPWFPDGVSSISPNTPFGQDMRSLLSSGNLKAIVLACLVSKPHVLSEEQYQLHLAHIRKVAATLTVQNDPKILEAFEVVKNLHLRNQNQAILDGFTMSLTNKKCTTK